MNSFTNKEKELLTTIEALKKENLQAIDKIERQHKLQLEEKDREWKEKMTSLQNSMDAAQGEKYYVLIINFMIFLVDIIFLLIIKIIF